jgi:hypothetical protein
MDTKTEKKPTVNMVIESEGDTLKKNMERHDREKNFAINRYMANPKKWFMARYRLFKRRKR